jgi:streptogramin lyase
VIVTDSGHRLRAIEKIPPPDLWPEIERRAESSDIEATGPVFRSSSARRIGAVVVTALILGGLAWTLLPLSGLLKERPGTPAPGTVTRIPLGSPPGPPALGEDAAWVIAGEALFRIDATTFELTRIAVRGSPSSVAVGAGSVWVAVCTDGQAGQCQDGAVLRLDPLTHHVVQSTQVEGGDPIQVTVGEEAVWAVDNKQRGAVLRIDPGTAQITRRIFGEHCCSGPIPAQIAVGGGGVWVAEGDTGKVLRLDPGTGEIVARIDDVHVCQFAASEDALWVTNCGGLDLESSSNTVWRVDPATNRIVASFTVPGAPGLAAGEEGVWVASHADDSSEIRVWKVDTQENGLAGESLIIPVEPSGGGFRGLGGPPPVRLAVGEEAVWVSSWASGEILRIEL